MREGLTLGKGHDHSATCPYCGKRLEGASGVGHDSAPAPGAVCVCIGCTNVSRFGPDLALRKITLDELVELEQGTGGATLEVIRRAVRHARAEVMAESTERRNQGG